jgi:hypothetical protein
VKPATALATAFVVVAAGSGCSQAPAQAPRAAAPSTSPDPVTVCVNQLTYWAAEDLRGSDSQGYDYQHRGLTAQQADSLRGIVAEARGLAQEPAAAVVAERVRTACAAIAGPAS